MSIINKRSSPEKKNEVFIMKELPNRWDKEMEKPLYEEWKNKKLFAFNRKNVDNGKELFSIDTPPPYVNTPVHVGQTTTYVLMDFFARFQRMIGKEVLFPLGLDRNGLPIEMGAEKKYNIKLCNVTREEFIKMCEEMLQEFSLQSVDSFLRCGISFNSWNVGNGIGDVYMTDSPEYRALTQETFIDMWNKGLIYEDERINNYCPGCGTTIADAEIEYAELPTMMNEIVFKVKETQEDVVIATTRPELVCTCAMVIFNPADDRYKYLEGKTAITPLFNKEIPIKASPMAEMEKGTGLVMMCSAGDTHDIQFFREQNLKPVIAINADGRLNEHAEFLKGLYVKEARKKMIELLKEKGLLKKQTSVLHKTPVCERSKDPIEFISMKEFYVRQLDYKDKMKEIAKELNFYDPASRQILIDWIDAVSIDWPISRRRFYATEIPLWYCKKCHTPILGKKGTYVRPWKEKPPVEKCPKCSSSDFVGETRVLDTWFDSSISPLYILKYSRDNKFFQKVGQCTLRPQGKEIIRTWLYYTLLKCHMLTGKTIFRDAWINYHIIDDSGKKMSKSKGNVISPTAILDKYGAEPFRLWAAIEGNLTTTDFRCSFDRIEGAGKTLAKLWNVAKYISMFPSSKPKVLQPLDNWIINEMDAMAAATKKSFEVYDFHNPVVNIKHFIWETFASHYIELSKNRAYNSAGLFSEDEQNSAKFTLNYCLETLLRLLAPIIPFITYTLYDSLYEKDVHFQPFPSTSVVAKLTKQEKPSFTSMELEELDSIIWKSKKDKQLSLKSELSELVLPKKFEPIEKDLKAAHSVKKIVYTKDTTMTKIQINL